MKLEDINLRDVGNTINIIGAIYRNYGIDKDVLVYFPEETHRESAVLFDFLDLDLKDWEKFLRQSDLVETEVLAKNKYGDRSGVRKVFHSLLSSICRVKCNSVY